MIRRAAFQCALFFACLAVAATAAFADTALLEEHIRSESGFDGAVRIVEYGMDEKDSDYGYVTAEVPYRDIRGEIKHGQGRLYVKVTVLESGEPIPPFCHVHYEKSMDGARHWCEQGYLVVTPHYGDPQQGGYPLELCTGDSNNLSRALLQWVRRLPFVDPVHLHIDGGSAGGYMALAMSADLFPVASATAESPVCNWAYNLNYLDANKPASGFPLADFKALSDLKRSPLPILCSITGLADQSAGVFGSDFALDAYYLVSPIAYLDRITCPTQILCATGDMLVPMEQMLAAPSAELDTSLFPENYQRDFDALTLSDMARHRFVDFLPEDELSIHRIPLAEGMHEILLEHFLKEVKEPPSPPNLERPFDRDKQWNIVILDEGPPKPYSPHSRYKWRTSPDSFIAAYRSSPPSPEILNAAKLDRLLRRFEGDLDRLPKLADGLSMNRQNFPLLEELDVVTGLIDYGEIDSACAERMTQLYAESARKPFGESLTLDRLREELADIRGKLGLE